MPPRAGNGFTQHAAHGAAPCTSRTCAVGRRSNAHSAAPRLNGLASFRGFLPRALSNACPPTWVGPSSPRGRGRRRTKLNRSSRSVPAGPSRPSAAPRATLDSRRRTVQSRAARPQKLSPSGGESRPGSPKTITFPPESSGQQRLQDFSLSGANPRQHWILGVQRASAGTDVFPSPSTPLKLPQKLSPFSSNAAGPAPAPDASSRALARTPRLIRPDLHEVPRVGPFWSAAFRFQLLVR
jgi:hypothetical protein